MLSLCLTRVKGILADRGDARAMIFKRFAAGLRAQNWLAISIELAIVIVGVFVGTWVANWNERRAEQQRAQQMIGELVPGLQSFRDYFGSARTYYATTRAYADTAFAGWRGDTRVSDDQFVIGAYQASQIYTFGVNATNWTQVFGGARLGELDDPELRRHLANLMTLNFDQIDTPSIDTPYRHHVREVIPEDIQDAIRAQCGDRPPPDTNLIQMLPPTCSLSFPATRWADAARRLRSTPELVDELRWQRAAAATFLSNMELFEQETDAVLARIGSVRRR